MRFDAECQRGYAGSHHPRSRNRLVEDSRIISIPFPASTSLGLFRAVGRTRPSPSSIREGTTAHFLLPMELGQVKNVYNEPIDALNSGG